MRAIKFEGSTHKLGAPPGVTEDKCFTLHTRMEPGGEDDGMGPFMYSYWKPDADELAVLVTGGAVKLCVRGLRHPPVMVDAEHIKEIHDA